MFRKFLQRFLDWFCERVGLGCSEEKMQEITDKYGLL